MSPPHGDLSVHPCSRCPSHVHRVRPHYPVWGHLSLCQPRGGWVCVSGTQRDAQVLAKHLGTACPLSKVCVSAPVLGRSLPAQHPCTHACLRWSGEALLTPKALGSPVRNVSMGRRSGGWAALGVCAPSGGSSNCSTPGGWHMEVGGMAGGWRRPLALLGGMTTNTPLLAGAADMVLGGPGRQRLRRCRGCLHIRIGPFSFSTTCLGSPAHCSPGARRPNP